jgi:hypothetical protein
MTWFMDMMWADLGPDCSSDLKVLPEPALRLVTGVHVSQLKKVGFLGGGAKKLRSFPHMWMGRAQYALAASLPTTPCAYC